MPRIRPHMAARLGVLVATAGLALGACSSATTPPPAAQPTDAPGADVLTQAGGPVTVTFWHSMGGKNGEALKKLTDDFNAKNPNIKVDLVYKNKYDDAITAYKQAIPAKQTPSLIQVYDIGSRFMIDSKQTIPIQSFVDKDKYNISDIQPNIAGYYSIDNKLNSMPFNTSMPILYYNKTAFAKAGLDPTKPPTTLDEIRQYAEKLTVKDASGNTVQYGFGAAIYGWFLEQWTAVANEQYCDQGNGRDARATSTTFNSATQTKVLDWWQKMVADGLALNTGRDTNDAANAFTSQRVAIHLESTGNIGSYLAASTAANWEFGAGYYPKVNSSDTGGPIIGGASLWIDREGHSAAEQRASWEYVKFLSSADSQATWHTSTGYFPISKAALDTELDKTWRAQRPQFDVAVRQLADTKLSKATQGCLLGVMPKSRQLSEQAIENALTGSKPPQQALDASVAAVKQEIDNYNRSVK